MLTFKQFIIENDEKIPPKPGTTPIPDDHVRLYHQTNKSGLNGIKKFGKIDIEKSSKYEGFPAIWASEEGFYIIKKREKYTIFSRVYESLTLFIYGFVLHVVLITIEMSMLLKIYFNKV